MGGGRGALDRRTGANSAKVTVVQGPPLILTDREARQPPAREPEASKAAEYSGASTETKTNSSKRAPGWFAVLDHRRNNNMQSRSWCYVPGWRRRHSMRWRDVHDRRSWCAVIHHWCRCCKYCRSRCDVLLNRRRCCEDCRNRFDELHRRRKAAKLILRETSTENIGKTLLVAVKSAWSRCSRPCRQRGPATLRVAAGWCHGTVNRTAEQLSKEGSTSRLEQGSDGIRCEGEQGELGLTVFPSRVAAVSARHVGQAEGGSLRNAFGESPSGQKDS